MTKKTFERLTEDAPQVREFAYREIAFSRKRDDDAMKAALAEVAEVKRRQSQSKDN